MKIATFIATCLLAATTWASTAATNVYHDYDGALRGIALDNACITDTTVQTMHPTRNCLKLVPVEYQDQGFTHTDWVCEKWETANVSYSRAFSRRVCTDYKYVDSNQVCTAWAEQADFLPATIKIRVETSHGDHSNFPGESRQFTFPACY